MSRLLIATLGKDAPGVNAAIRSATRLALHKGFEVVGVKRGFPGLLAESFRPLKQPDVGFILGKGGSLLGSVDFRVGPDAHDVVDKIADRLKGFQLLVASGGLGSYAILSRVYATSKVDLPTAMFIPASVENEFLSPATGQETEEVDAEAIGADTAANTAIEAIDKLREQSYLTRTVFLIQCIGSKSNYLPIQIGLACGAHRIYLPQVPAVGAGAKEEIGRLFGGSFDPNVVNLEELVGWIEKMFEGEHKSYVVVLIPSGIPLGQVVSDQRGGEHAARRYDHAVSSVDPVRLTALRIVDELTMHFAETGSVQIRYVVLDDLQRGGAPTLRDRMLGSIYGEAAIEEYLSIVNSQEYERHGQLHLLDVRGTSKVAWRCWPRNAVLPLFTGPEPRANGLDPLPFFRQSRGTVSGYRYFAMA